MPSIKTPDWVKDAVFYQIFPDRFAQSPLVPKAAGLEAWATPPTTFGYKGGDLLGVMEHLDHIQELGCTAIYFCPIFQSACNHRYHTHDYYQVDPMLGGNEAFLKLLDAAHRRGLRVVLDGVFNHASRGFFYFNDILENGRASAYLDWFVIRDFPPNAYDHTRSPGYDAWVGLHALPKLNTYNPRVREYIMQVAEHWLRVGIDGWRLDVPFEIKTPGFWEEFRQRVKAINPEAYIVGEVWEPAQPFLQGNQFDAVMNYPFAEAALAFCAGPRIVKRHYEGRSYNPGMNLDAAGYADRIDWLLNLYPWEIQLAQLNLLDSHDAARAVTLAGGDQASAHLATLLLCTFPGAVSVYYGDEIGLPGGMPDYDTRPTFPWDRPALWKPDVLTYHKALIALRHKHPALRRGTYHRLHAQGGVYAFGRRFGSDAVVVAVNVAETSQFVQVPVADFWADGVTPQVEYGPGGGRVQNGLLALNLPARSGVVLSA